MEHASEECYDEDDSWELQPENGEKYATNEVKTDDISCKCAKPLTMH